MDDITKDFRFQRILHEAAQYRVLRQIFESDRDYENAPKRSEQHREDERT